MKSALFVFAKFVLLTMAFCTLSVKANDLSIEPLLKVDHLKDSPSISIVRDFMNEVHSDLDSYYVIQDRNLKLPLKHSCVQKSKTEVVRMITKSIMHTLKFYPDEDLPISEAISDLKMYLKEDKYEMCSFSRIIKDEKFDHSLFYSLDGAFFLRLDFVTPAK